MVVVVRGPVMSRPPHCFNQKEGDMAETVQVVMKNRRDKRPVAMQVKLARELERRGKVEIVQAGSEPFQETLERAVIERAPEGTTPGLEKKSEEDGTSEPADPGSEPAPPERQPSSPADPAPPAEPEQATPAAETRSPEEDEGAGDASDDDSGTESTEENDREEDGDDDQSDLLHEGDERPLGKVAKRRKDPAPKLSKRRAVTRPVE